MRLVDVGALGRGVAADLGGFLRCETCRRVEPVDGTCLATGWPKCCGYTMRWWTARQVRDGEVSK